MGPPPPPSKYNVLHSKTITQTMEFFLSKSLGEDIDSLLSGRVVLQIDDPVMNQLLNKMQLDLTGFTDFDWASDDTNRKSNSGYMLSLGSDPICSFEKKQLVLALSSVQVEYMGAFNIII
jgi:hypothetical protein